MSERNNPVLMASKFFENLFAAHSVIHCCGSISLWTFSGNGWCCEFNDCLISINAIMIFEIGQIHFFIVGFRFQISQSNVNNVNYKIPMTAFYSRIKIQLASQSKIRLAEQVPSLHFCRHTKNSWSLNQMLRQAKCQTKTV
jgi:hypothetical protein